MPVTKSTKKPAVTTGARLEGPSSLYFFTAKAAVRHTGQVIVAGWGSPAMSLRGSLTLKGGFNTDLQNLGHSTVGQTPSMWHGSGAAEVQLQGCTCWVGGAAQVALSRRWEALALRLSPHTLEIPPNPQPARPSSINPPYFSWQLYCPLALYPWHWCIYHVLRLG